ncbi:MAG: hypothetical protein PHN72_04605 [Bacilli bacterium]|nr:hypothetical protein [Bacilli bacterium]
MAKQANKSVFPIVDEVGTSSIFLTGTGIMNAQIRVVFPNAYTVYTVVPFNGRFEIYIPPLARPLEEGKIIHIYQTENSKDESESVEVKVFLS